MSAERRWDATERNLEALLRELACQTAEWSAMQDRLEELRGVTFEQRGATATVVTALPPCGLRG